MKIIAENPKFGFGYAEEINKTTYIKTLQPVRSIFQILGTLAKFPQLLLNLRMNLSQNDFIQDCHQIMFIAIQDIVCKDNTVKSITHIDIDNHLSKFDDLYQLWNEYDGLSYMREAIEYSNGDTFKYHYRELKKFSIMRDFAFAGVDVVSLFNYLESDLELHVQSKKDFESLEYETVENKLIELGRGNEGLIHQLNYTVEEINNQIALLEKQKQQIILLREKLIRD